MSGITMHTQCSPVLSMSTVIVFFFRNITPQVSYMKAIDLWVFVCILFVFSTLAQYGIILHLTSRSVWQKKVDSHYREITGEKKIRKIPVTELLKLSVDSEPVNRPPQPDFENINPDWKIVSV